MAARESLGDREAEQQAAAEAVEALPQGREQLQVVGVLPRSEHQDRERASQPVIGSRSSTS